MRGQDGVRMSDANGHAQGATIPAPSVQRAIASQQERSEAAVDVAVKAARRNASLNVVVRALLGTWALLALALAMAYVTVRSGEIVDELANGVSEDEFVMRLIALILPAVVLVMIAAGCTGAAWLLYSRGREDLERGMESIARLQREAEVAIAARGLTHVFEEKLETAHRAFSLQLWLGRTLFVVSLTLFAGAITQAVAAGIDLTTLALGSGALTSALYGTARAVPHRIACHLADVLQMQCAVTGCIRQISLIEAQAYALLSKGRADPERSTQIVSGLQVRIDEAVQATVARIEKYADPSHKGR
jgi:hypothetical protein